MKRDDIIARLKEAEPALRARGIRHVALFGSVARGEERPDSDIDILVDLDPQMHLTIYDYVGIKEYVSDLFGGPVDVISRGGLKPFIRPRVTAEAIYAF
jgi:predicted nucleotidyltransferase